MASSGIPGASFRRKSRMEVGSVGPNRISVGGRQAAIGLLWQPVRDGVTLRDQAELAGGPQSNLDLIAQFGGRQHGFGSTIEGLSSGMTAAASLFDPAVVGETWLGAFELSADPQRWWVVAMRNLLVYEDQAHSDAASAKQAFLETFRAPDWEHIFAPPKWCINGAKHAEIEQLLSFKSTVRLRQVDPTNRLVAWIGAGLLLAGAAAFGWNYYSGIQAEKEQREFLDALSKNKVDVPVPWRNAPRIEEFVQACGRDMEKLLILPLGWEVISITCEHSDSRLKASVRWKRDNGRSSTLRTAVYERVGLNVEQTGGGEGALASITTNLPGGSLDFVAPDWSAGKIEAILRDRFQSLGLEIILIPRIAKAGSRRSPDPATLSFNHHELTIATSAAVDEYARLISDVPGLVPTTLTYNAPSNAWTMSARVYHAVPSLGATGSQLH